MSNCICNQNFMGSLSPVDLSLSTDASCSLHQKYTKKSKGHVFQSKFPFPMGNAAWTSFNLKAVGGHDQLIDDVWGQNQCSLLCFLSTLDIIFLKEKRNEKGRPIIFDRNGLSMLLICFGENWKSDTFSCFGFINIGFHFITHHQRDKLISYE